MAAKKTEGGGGLKQYANSHAPHRGTVCRACALPAALRAEVDEYMREFGNHRRVIVSYLAEAGHDRVTVNCLSYHFGARHHLAK